jgi:hypothetical protein
MLAKILAQHSVVSVILDLLSIISIGNFMFLMIKSYIK